MGSHARDQPRIARCKPPPAANRLHSSAARDTHPAASRAAGGDKRSVGPDGSACAACPEGSTTPGKRAPAHPPPPPLPLQALDVSHNRLRRLPLELGWLPLKSLNVRGNERLTSPGKAVLAKGLKAVLCYLQVGGSWGAAGQSHVHPAAMQFATLCFPAPARQRSGCCTCKPAQAVGEQRRLATGQMAALCEPLAVWARTHGISLDATVQVGGFACRQLTGRQGSPFQRPHCIVM